MRGWKVQLALRVSSLGTAASPWPRVAWTPRALLQPSSPRNLGWHYTLWTPARMPSTLHWPGLIELGESLVTTMMDIVPRDGQTIKVWGVVSSCIKRKAGTLVAYVPSCLHERHRLFEGL